MDDSRSKNAEVSVWKYAIGLAVAWTVIVGVSLVWNIIEEYANTSKLAMVRANEAFSKDVTYRKWAASHGGVYVM